MNGEKNYQDGSIFRADRTKIVIGTEYGLYLARASDLEEVLKGKRSSAEIFFKGDRWRNTPNTNHFTSKEE